MVEAYALSAGRVELSGLARLHDEGVVRAAALTVGGASAFLAFEADTVAELERQVHAAREVAGPLEVLLAAGGVIVGPRWPSRILPGPVVALLHLQAVPGQLRELGATLARREPHAAAYVAGHGAGFLLEWTAEDVDSLAEAVVEAGDLPGVRSSVLAWTAAELTVGFGGDAPRGVGAAQSG